MEPNKDEKLCKFHNTGFCKFKDQCHFRHVHDVCLDRSCPRRSCSARHPKRCRYFLKKRCKFGDDCAYSHDVHEADDDEIDSLKRLLKELEQGNIKLKKSNDLKASELEQVIIKHFATIEELNELRKINKCLIEDIKLLNEKLKPGAVEQENEKLKENLAILQTVVQIYKQAEIAEQDVSDENEPEDESEPTQVNSKYKCDYCDFESDTNRGVCVHIGIKHKKTENRNDFNLINF